MTKSTSIFVCQSCAYESSKWLGKCPSCFAWNSFIEEIKESSKNSSFSRQPKQSPSVCLSEIKEEKSERIKSDISELDRALGGGIVPGSLILLAGDPGIGKSTLVSQLIAKTGGAYLCAEESPQQIKIRFQRFNLHNADSAKNMHFYADNNVESFLNTLENDKKLTSESLIIIDSIQTVFTPSLRSSIGSASQIRECTNLIFQFAKSKNIAVFIIGHITKEGSIAGPKALEHLVDVVLYLSGDKFHQFRLLESVKNRFGATDEVGIFDMTQTGLISVKDPTKIFLTQAGKKPGSILTMIMQGTRPILVEVQALAVKSKLAIPRRVAEGVSNSKLQLICAVLQKHLNLPLFEYDIFVNISGGLTIKEPAIELAIAAAIYSSIKNKSPKPKSLFFGEVGLLGDINTVSFGKRREKEAKNIGYNNICSAETGQKQLKNSLIEFTS